MYFILSTLTIEPMMLLWSLGGNMVKVSQEQMLFYKVSVTTRIICMTNT